MTKKITYYQLREMLADPAVSEESLKPYLTTERMNGSDVDNPINGMGPILLPSKLVDSSVNQSPSTQANLGMGLLNAIYRSRRRKRFESEMMSDSRKPILLAEGDSWFEYPIWLDDTIDNLSKHYSIFCLSAAGDELQGMIAEAEYKDYLEELINQRGLKVEGILLSGGGNDIVGKTFYHMLHDYEPGAIVDDLVNKAAFKKKFNEIHRYYTQVIEFISETYPDIPVFIHSYDHANPLPDQGYSLPPLDGWLGKWLRKRGILDQSLQRGVVRQLIDGFCDHQQKLASEFPSVTFIDCRGLVGDQWHDELHPNNKGFEIVANKFHSELVKAGVGGV